MEDFIVRLYQPGLSRRATVRPVCFSFFIPSPVHVFTQAFNGIAIVDALIKTYVHCLYQDILVIARHHVQNHFQIILVIAFFLSLEVLHPQGDLPVSGYINKDTFGQLLCPNTLGPSVSFVINRFSFSGTEGMSGDDFSRLLAVQFHIPLSFLQPDPCLPAPVSAAGQALIIPPILDRVVLTHVILLHLLLWWLR